MSADSTPEQYHSRGSPSAEFALLALAALDLIPYPGRQVARLFYAAPELLRGNFQQVLPFRHVRLLANTIDAHNKLAAASHLAGHELLDMKEILAPGFELS